VNLRILCGFRKLAKQFDKAPLRHKRPTRLVLSSDFREKRLIRFDLVVQCVSHDNVLTLV